MIQEKFAELSTYTEEREGPLSLVFDGRVLENGKQLAEYVHSASATAEKDSRAASSSVFQKRSVTRAWPKPFAGSCLCRKRAAFTAHRESRRSYHTNVGMSLQSMPHTRDHLGRSLPTGAHDVHRVGAMKLSNFSRLTTTDEADACKCTNTNTNDVLTLRKSAYISRTLSN